LQKPVLVSLQLEADVAVGMIVRVQTVVNVAQRTKDVVVYQVDSVGVGIECLLLNTYSAISHGENKLISNEMMVRSTRAIYRLCKFITCCFT
jgi:hypothetical protein